MCKKLLVLFAVVLLSSTAWSAPSDEPSDMLARAEALYYEADFAKSVELLCGLMKFEQAAQCEER
jgi:hypothetical protein